MARSARRAYTPSTVSAVSASPTQLDLKGGRSPQLTEHELEVLQLLNDGLRPRQIAAQLHYGEAMIRKRIAAINDKLGTNSYFASLILARWLGILEMSSG